MACIQAFTAGQAEELVQAPGVPERVRELAAALLRLTRLRAAAAEAEALKVRCQVPEAASYKQAEMHRALFLHLHLAMHSAGHWSVRRLSLVTCIHVGTNVLCMQVQL
jgi:hypothetical protein